MVSIDKLELKSPEKQKKKTVKTNENTRFILEHVSEESIASPHLSPLLNTTAEFTWLNLGNEFSFHQDQSSSMYKIAIWW